MPKKKKVVEVVDEPVEIEATAEVVVETPEEAPVETTAEVAVPNKPVWVDHSIWEFLSAKGKVALCNGASIAEAKAL